MGLRRARPRLAWSEARPEERLWKSQLKWYETFKLPRPGGTAANSPVIEGLLLGISGCGATRLATSEQTVCTSWKQSGLTWCTCGTASAC